MLLELFCILINEASTQVYMHAKIHQATHLRSEHFILRNTPIKWIFKSIQMKIEHGMERVREGQDKHWEAFATPGEREGAGQLDTVPVGQGKVSAVWAVEEPSGEEALEQAEVRPPWGTEALHHAKVSWRTDPPVPPSQRG